MATRRKNINWQQWFQNKARLKVFAVALALLAWFLVQTSQPVKEFRFIELRYVNEPNLSFSKKPIDRVRVTLTGSLYRIRSLNSEDLTYEVDLTRLSEGKHSLDFDVANLRLPYEIGVENPFPRRFEVQLERTRTKNLPVELKFLSPPPELYVVSAVRIDPNPIQVRGAQSIVQALEKIEIPIELEGRRSSFETSVLLNSPHPLVETLSLVSIQVDLRALDSELILETVEVKSQESGTGAVFTPSTARVVLRGNREELEDPELQVEVFVPVEGLSRAQGQRVEGRVQVSHPNVKVVSLEPRQFIVDFRR